MKVRIIIQRVVPALMLLILFAVQPAGCTGSKEVCKNDLAGRYNHFGFDIYRKLASAGSENVFVSPASIALAIAMTQQGTSSETASEIASVLHIGDLSDEQILACNRALLDSLSSRDTSIVLDIANSLWLRKDFAFRKSFVDITGRYFDAGLFPIETAEAINHWVSEKTRGRIDEIIREIRPDDLAFIINAVYFKGEWSKPFDRDLTSEEDFHISKNGTVQVPMMKQSGEYAYFETPDFQALSLPYGDGRLSMKIFLPSDGSSLKEFNASLGAESWKNWDSKFESREGRIELPRFRISFSAEIGGVLADLGMGIAFGGKADFSRMCEVSPGQLYIGEVLHKTFLEVNEKGSEAAAVTAVTIRLTAAIREPEPFTMIVDRPFFAAIVDDISGSILFMGMISDPSQ